MANPEEWTQNAEQGVGRRAALDLEDRGEGERAERADEDQDARGELGHELVTARSRTRCARRSLTPEFRGGRAGAVGRDRGHAPRQDRVRQLLGLERVERRGAMVGREREEHALERAHHQLQAADQNAGVAERGHQLVHVIEAGGHGEAARGPRAGSGPPEPGPPARAPARRRS